MKNRILIKSAILSLLIVVGIGTSCTQNFDEMNKHPFQPTETSANFLFNGMVSYVKWPGNYWLYAMNQRLYQWGQLAASAGGGQGAEGEQDPNNFNTLGSGAIWYMYYDMARTYRALENKLNSDVDPDRVINRVALMKIIWAYMSLQATDMYGDIPYFDAGKGATENIYRPKYDTQEEIYKDALNQLKWAVDNIIVDYHDKVTPAGNKYLDYGANDIMYNNDMAKWKKFANTLRLRHALRMSNIDPVTAKEHGSDAFAKGLIEGSDDEFIFSQNNGVANGSLYWSFQYYGGIRLGENAWKFMNADDDPAADGSDIIDPRVYIWYETNENDEWVAMPQSWGIADRPDGPTGHPYNDDRRNDNDDLGGNFKGNYSGFNWYLVEDTPNSYEFHVTYAESCFLRAEAILKGWGTGDAQSWYEEGIKASIVRWYTYGRNHEDWATPPPMPTEAEMNAFISHPRIAYKGDNADGLLQIQIQRWLDYTFNAAQAWYLARRADNFPLLPVRHRVTGDIVPMARRFPYPVDEVNQNGENYKEQVDGRMGGKDDVTTSIWWDTSN